VEEPARQDIRAATAAPRRRRVHRRPAPNPPGFVPRPRLVERLSSFATPVVLVVAPPGFGKTALVTDWSERDARPFLWLGLEEADNDPERLTARVGDALREALDEAPAPFVLVLDDVHTLHSDAALETVRRLIHRIARPSQLVLIARRQPVLPLGRLRAQRVVSELQARELAMTPDEAAAMLGACGIELARDARAALAERTEGWPAALYLAALSLRDAPDPTRAARAFAGDHAAVAAYLREEVLDEMSDGDREFLLRASVLGRLTGPSCDAVLERDDSGQRLAAAAAANLLLVPLDPAHRTYRWHPLLREMLSAELRRLWPREETELHRRACTWHLAAGERERAVEHALAARDLGRAGELLHIGAGDYVTQGRNVELQRLLLNFGGDDLAARPELALAAAASHLAAGELPAAQRAETLARMVLEQSGRRKAPRDLAATAALAHAALSGNDMADLAAVAHKARRTSSELGALRSLCCLLEGVALHLTGHAAAAEERLTEGARLSGLAAPALNALCLSQLALIAAGRDDWDAAAVSSSQAATALRHSRLASYPPAATVFATSALVRSRRGVTEPAREAIASAQHGLQALRGFVPWYEAQARVVLARALVGTGDVAEARAQLDEAARVARPIAGAAVLEDWIAAAGSEVDAAVGAMASGPLALTKAEMRVLRFLPTHLSFREIAGRLFVSANTVKTQAHSVYRKLEASSRSEAVQRATQLGLLTAGA
jgi:LuxR family maltose regulon positive regulatory protein